MWTPPRHSNAAFRLSLVLFLLGIAVAGATPVIVNVTESIKPGEVISIQGDDFGTSPEVWVDRIEDANDIPNPEVRLPNVLTKSSQFVAAEFPRNMTMGLYAVFIKDAGDGSVSAPKFVNKASPWQYLDLAGSGIVSNLPFRIYGRNLEFDGAVPTVRFRHTSLGTLLNATVIQTSDPYVLKVVAPPNLIVGQTYDVLVNNGYGGSSYTAVAPRLKASQPGVDHWNLGTAAGQTDYKWYNNVYNVKTDSRIPLANRAVGDGIADDHLAIQTAVNLANAAGGGVVYLPAGTYNLNGVGIAMKSSVVIQGAGRDVTVVYDNKNGGGGDMFGGGANMTGIDGVTLQSDTGGFGTIWDVGGSGYFSCFITNCRFLQAQAKGIDHGAGGFVIRNNEIFQNAISGNSVIDVTSRWDVMIKDNVIHWSSGRVVFLSCLRLQLEGNTWSRSVTSTYLVGYGGPSFGGANYVAILNNTFDKQPLDRNGNPADNQKIPKNNDGETLLNENIEYSGTGHATSGTVNTLTNTTLTDNGGTGWTANSKANWEVSIVQGRGMGQSRVILSNTANTLTVDSNWDVTPDATSYYAITKFDHTYLCKGNTLREVPRGIWLTYAASMRDVAIVDNKLIDGQGIYLRGDTRSGGRFNVLKDIIVEGNYLENTKNWYPAQIVLSQVYVDGAELTGSPFYNVVVRHNSITIPSTGGLSGDDGSGEGDGYFANQHNLADDDSAGAFGVIFDNNTATNLTSAYGLNSGSYNTVIFNSINNNVGQDISDSTMTGATHASVGTVLAWTHSDVAPPYVWLESANPTEGGNPGYFRIWRSGTTGDLQVSYGVTATAEREDYVENLPGTVTIPNGKEYVDIPVTAVDDVLAEGNETITLTLVPNAGFNMGNRSITMTIIDNDMLLSSGVIGTNVGGSFAVDDGLFKLSGGGAGVTGTADNFRYAFQPLVGDGSITAHLTALTSTNTFGRAGVMIRESLGQGSIQLSSFVTFGQGGRYSRRIVTDGANTDTSVTGMSAPYWVRVTRTGNKLEAFARPESGGNWVSIGSATISTLPKAMYIGLAATASLAGRSTSATFQDVAIVGNSDVPEVKVQATSSTASELGNAPATFTVSRLGATTDALQVNYSVAGSATPGTDYASLAGSVTIPVGQLSAPVVVTPISDQLAEGSENVTLTLTPRAAYKIGSSGQATATIEDLPIDDWRFNNFGVNASNAAIAGDAADPDSDGIANLMEYAIGLNPNGGDLNGIPDSRYETIDGAPYLTLTYPKLRPDILYSVQASADLVNWSTIPDQPAGFSGGVALRKAFLPASGDRQFLRLSVIRQ